MSVNDAEETAVNALREATQVLGIGRQAAQHADSGSDDAQGVALEVAKLLDATVHLLRSTDIAGVPAGSDAHRLHAVVQHLSNGAELARRGQTDDRPISSHPEPRSFEPTV